MFLPVLHDRMVVSRRPWATFATIGLCVAVFLATHGSDAGRESERLFEKAVAFHLAHPETRPDERLISADLASDLRLALAEAGVEPPATSSESAFADPQVELDRLTSDWLATLPRDPAWRWGLVPRERRPETFVTHQFLHGGWLHLVGNLFLFFLVAPLVEEALGTPRFALLYLGLGAFAGMAYLLHYPDLFRPLVGASGAISAVLGLFVVLFARMRLKYLLWIGVPLGTFEAPAWAMLPLWFLFQVYLGLEADRWTVAGGGVAYWAHAWGFAAGVAAALVLRRGRATTAVAVAEPDPLIEVRRLLAAGRREEAWTRLVREARAHPERHDALHELCNLARQLGRRADAAFALARLVRHEARRGDVLRALEMWEELRSARREPHVDPALSLAVVEALEREQLRREDRETLLADAVESASTATSTETLAALARAVATSGSSAARTAWSSLTARVDLAGKLGSLPPQTPK